MKNVKLHLATVITILGLISTFSVQAKVWRVNKNPGCFGWTNVSDKVFSSLLQAVEQASANDTLYIEGASTAYEAITLTKKLTLIGTGYLLDQNLNLQHNSQTSKVESVTFGAGSDGSVLSGLEMFGATAFGDNAIYFSSNTLSNLTITRCKVAYIAFQNVAGVALNNITITKNYIVEFGIRAEAFGGNGPISNFILRNNYIGQLFLNNDFSGAITQNVVELNVSIYGTPFFNNIVLGDTINQNGVNNASNIHHNIFDFTRPVYLQGDTTNYFSLSADYVFINQNDTDDKKYILKTQASNLCPECYLGFSPSPQIGMYGGLDPYIASGIPNIPTIYLLQSQAEGNAASGLNVTISTKSNN